MKIIEWIFWVLMMCWAGLAVTPASYWYDAGELAARDSIEGEDIRLLYSGGAKRHFNGVYSVTARNIVTNHVEEDGPGVIPYGPDKTRPDPLFLYDWWAPDLEALGPGQWSIVTCWAVKPTQIWFRITPPKITCTDPALFEVAKAPP